MGKIILEGIEVMARIGLLEEEQFAPQNLRVSLEVSYDFEKIQGSDEMADGIDYSDLIESVRAFCSFYDGKTLEKFAHLLAIQIKKEFPVEHLKLAVDKPRYTKKLGLREIRVEIER